MNREEAIQKVCGDLDPRIAQLEAREIELLGLLENVRLNLKERRESKALRIERIERFYDAQEVVADPPNEVKDGG